MIRKGDVGSRGWMECRPANFAGFHSQQADHLRHFMLSIPIANQSAAQSMRRALVRLRGVLLFYSQLKAVVRYGTMSQLLDASDKYKVNLNDLVHSLHKYKPSAVSPPVPLRRWVIHPDASWLALWNVVILLLMLYSFLIVPYLIAFEDVDSGSPWFLVDICVDSLFFIDILLTLNLAYFDSSNHLVTSHTSIFLNYLSGMLIIDCVSTFPVYLVTLNGPSGTKSNSLIRFARITKLSKLFRALKVKHIMRFFSTSSSMKQCITLWKRYDGVTRLLGALNLVAILCHLMACMWFFMAKMADFGPETWVTRNNLQDQGDFTLYLTSFYWAITTLTTVGFGDIHARTSMEIGLAMVWMLFGVGFYSFVMGSVSSMMTGLDADAAYLEQRLQTIDLFSKDTGIPKRTIRLVSSSIRSITEGISLTEPQRIDFIKSLPRSLRTEVTRTMYNHAAKSIEVLKDVNSTCIARFFMRAERRICAAKTVVYMEGDAAEMLYFVVEGRVRLVIHRRNLVFKTIVSGSFFGESELLSDRFREFTAETETSCDILILSKEVFFDLITSFPDIRAKIMSVIRAREVTDKERMNQLLDLLEAVEIRKEVTYQDLAGTCVVSHSKSNETQENTRERITECLQECGNSVKVRSKLGNPESAGETRRTRAVRA